MEIQKFDNMEDGIEQVNKMLENALKGVHAGAVEITKLQQRNLQIGMMQKNLVYSGDTIRSIQVGNPAEGHYTTNILSTGFMIDSMNTHYVKLLPDRHIYYWALRKGNQYVQAIARAHGSILVSKHPFIEDATNKTLPKVDEIVKRNVITAISEAR